MKRMRLLVCDLDNTMYDWVGYFVPAFYAMVDEVVRITGYDQETLLSDFREVHQHHHDAEHPFALLETSTVHALFPHLSRRERAVALDSAFHAFNTARKERLRLYPGVRMSLETLESRGVTLVAHTESKFHAVVDRLTRLELTHFFRRIYCRQRSESTHPYAEGPTRLESSFPMQKVVELSHHQRKPSPEVLLEICHDERVPLTETAYVGDSIARDMLMAKEAGVFAIWAKYGSVHDKEAYGRLVRVTHWTEADVTRERELRERARSVQPDYVLEHGFDEILDALPIEHHRRSAIGA